MLCIQAIVYIVFAILNYTFYIRKGYIFSNNMTLFIFLSDLIFALIINYVCLMEYGTLAWVLAILPFLGLLLPQNLKFSPELETTVPKDKTTVTKDKKKESFSEWGRELSTMDYGKTPYSVY